MEQGQKEAIEEAALHPHSSDPDSGEDLGPTPPDSPVPSTGAFTTHSGGLNLDDEFFAIPASNGKGLENEIDIGCEFEEVEPKRGICAAHIPF